MSTGSYDDNTSSTRAAFKVFFKATGVVASAQPSDRDHMSHTNSAERKFPSSLEIIFDSTRSSPTAASLSHFGLNLPGTTG